MKVAEQISLLMSGKVTYDQLKELKAEEQAEANEPPQEPTEPNEPQEPTEPSDPQEPQEPVNDKALQDALAQVEALTKQVEELQKQNTQRDVEGKAGGEPFDMSEFVKNFRG